MKCSELLAYLMRRSATNVTLGNEFGMRWQEPMRHLVRLGVVYIDKWYDIARDTDRVYFKIREGRRMRKAA